MLFEEFKEFKEFWRGASKQNPGASRRMMIQTPKKKTSFVEVISNQKLSNQCLPKPVSRITELCSLITDPLITDYLVFSSRRYVSPRALLTPRFWLLAPSPWTPRTPELLELLLSAWQFGGP